MRKRSHSLCDESGSSKSTTGGVCLLCPCSCICVCRGLFAELAVALNTVRGIGLRMWVRRSREKYWHLQNASAVLCCRQNMIVKYVHGIGSEPCGDQLRNMKALQKSIFFTCLMGEQDNSMIVLLEGSLKILSVLPMLISFLSNCCPLVSLSFFIIRYIH